nr:uncharacterized protein C8orf48 homolog isoform X1 [Pogona vitticeps]XP_020640091.1 uncharacterized protein C8orf48 homolog isoform X1 [Pogona vitticeps]XP_020640092.1 uncharacterized protein C8orf48 homolog isoform X1 [Pogona vitticeps]
MEVSYGCSSSVPEDSDDNFASFSEGKEGEPSRNYENDPFESYSSGEKSELPSASDQSESTWQSSGQNDEVGQDPEFLNPLAVGEYIPEKWISLLQNKRAGTEVARTAREPNKGISEVSEEERGARQSFCAIKINQLRRPPSLAPPKRNKRNDQRHGCASEGNLTCDLNCIVPDQLLNRLRLKNIKEAVKQIAETEMHHPSQCFPCMEKKAELAKSAFLRRSKTLVEEVLLQEKLEEHLYAKDSLTLIGEIHRTLPKLSEDPKNIWWKLNERGLKASSGALFVAKIN